LVSPLSNVGLATLSRLRDDLDKYNSYYTKALRLLAFVGVFGSLILTLSGRDLIFILLGPGWEQAGSIVTFFGPGIGGMIIYYTCSWIHLSLARPDRWLRWNLIAIAVTASFISVSAPFGPVYVAAAYSISFYILLIPALWYAGRPISLRVNPLLKAIGLYFIAGIVTWIIWITSTELLSATSSFITELRPVMKFIIVFSYCCVLYTTMVVALHRSIDPVKGLVSVTRTLVQRDKSKMPATKSE
jgi:PST family polysaccharide transporter